MQAVPAFMWRRLAHAVASRFAVPSAALLELIWRRCWWRRCAGHLRHPPTHPCLRPTCRCCAQAAVLVEALRDACVQRTLFRPFNDLMKALQKK